MSPTSKKGSFMNVEIAQRLAAMRREQGYSQEELAERLGLSRQAVSKWERAESSPDTGNLIALAKLYGVSIDDLLRIDDDVADDVAFEEKDKDATAEAQAQEAAVRANEAAVRAAQAAVAAAQARATAEQRTRPLRRSPNRSPSLSPCSSPATARPPCPSSLRNPRSRKRLTPRKPRKPPSPTTPSRAARAAPGRRSRIPCSACSCSWEAASSSGGGIPAGSSSSPSRCTTGSPTSSKTTRTIGRTDASGRAAS